MKKMQLSALILIIFSLFCLPSTVLAQSVTDVIREYRVNLQPQDDGSLINTYIIKWCVLSNDLGPLSDFYVGMPNEKYKVMDISGDASNVRPANQGADTKVNVMLTRSINAGECATVTFRIHQQGIAHLDSAKGEIGFQFIPGWFDEIQVEYLKLTWYLPGESAQLKSISPEPKSRDANQAVWETSLQPGEKFTINLLYDQAAFPNFGKQSTPVWPLQDGNADNGGTSTTDESGAANMDQNSLKTSDALLGGILPVSLVTCICLVLLFIFIILVLVSVISSGVRSYRSGGTIGSPRTGSGGPIIIPLPRTRSSSGGIFGGSGTRSTTPNRSGGGGGLFGGRGSSCACVSCACACACAGGGRAGCSRKGFDISGLLKKADGKQGNEK